MIIIAILLPPIHFPQFTDGDDLYPRPLLRKPTKDTSSRGGSGALFDVDTAGTAGTADTAALEAYGTDPTASSLGQPEKQEEQLSFEALIAEEAAGLKKAQLSVIGGGPGTFVDADDDDLRVPTAETADEVANGPADDATMVSYQVGAICFVLSLVSDTTHADMIHGHCSRYDPSTSLPPIYHDCHIIFSRCADYENEPKPTNPFPRHQFLPPQDGSSPEGADGAVDVAGTALVFSTLSSVKGADLKEEGKAGGASSTATADAIPTIPDSAERRGVPVLGSRRGIAISELTEHGATNGGVSESHKFE